MNIRGKVLTISTLLVQMLFSQFQNLKSLSGKEMMQGSCYRIITDLLLEESIIAHVLH